MTKCVLRHFTKTQKIIYKMYSAKFIVYYSTLLYLLFGIVRMINGTSPIQNANCKEDNDLKSQNCRRLRKRSYSTDDMGREINSIGELRQHGPDTKVHRGLNKTKLNRSGNDDNEFHFLITGGYRPEVNELVKYVVSIRTRKERKFFGDNHICGGSIISPRTVLTAAHCMFNRGSKVRANNVKVVAGTPRRLMQTTHTQEILVDRLMQHPRYSARTLKNDVGLVKMRKALRLNSDFVSAIPLPRSRPKSGLKCTVVGWGTVIQFGPVPDEVINGDVSVMSDSFCRRLEYFTKGMICASNSTNHETDSCQGDSGGPLICNGLVVGIVSFGSGCGEPNSAGVYTDVYYFRNWIETNSASYTSNNCASFCFIILISLTNYVLCIKWILRGT